MLGDQAPLLVMSHLFPVVLAWIVDAEATGLYRIAFLPFMAAETMLAALRVLVLPQLDPNGDRPQTRTSLLQSTLRFSALSGALLGVTMLLLATPVGAVLGDPFKAVGFAVLAAAVMVFVRTTIRIPSDFSVLRMKPRHVLRVRTSGTLLEFLFATLGAVFFGVGGAIWARTLLGVAIAVDWAWRARRLAATHGHTPTQTNIDAETAGKLPTGQ